ncbi:uncharacterized protein LOC115965145 [Quercus lobata]|uniref:uncharacterized protein LOC115965145 n=1 Tax=Quercus lobata TaxID=97700 RepID=UPI001245DC96|nr:uncharacterized protein LOC115965145 [Quercus lobata]
MPVEESQPEPKRARRNFHPFLSFSEEDMIGITQPHDDALLITLRIGGYDVKRVMVDGGSAVEVMYLDLYKGLGLKSKDLMPYSSLLMTFDGKLVIPKGMIRLPIQTGPEIVEVNFIVVDKYSPYTAIVGRPWLHTLGAVASSLHQKTPNSPPDTTVDEAKCKDLEKVVIGGDSEKIFWVGAQLPLQEKEELIEFLKRNIDVFSWDACDAPRIDPDVICHYLNVNLAITPKKQPPCCPSKEHADAIRDEMAKLKRVRAIKEVFYPEWLANTVVVKKKSGKWRVCMDFTDLNKACPKNPFPMPRIDQLVDAIAGHPRMSVLGAFQGYHQIPLALED